MITIEQKGNFEYLTTYLAKVKKVIKPNDLKKYGEEGIAALALNTPMDTGKTAVSWVYHIRMEDGSAAIEFHNENIQNGIPIVILLQYGHATKNGYWIEGRDFINPVIQPIFDKIADKAWREVTDE